MTVDVAGAHPAVPPAPTPQARMSFEDKVKYCNFLAAADLLPRQYQAKPANVYWAMEWGDSVGLATVVAINGVHIIEGKPSPSAATASALIRARGHKLHVWTEPPGEGSRWGRGVAELTRLDDPDFTFRAEWSVEDAVRAEICQIKDGEIYHRTHNGKTGNWQKYPKQMMKARALGEVCRDGATDVLMGLVYLAEEYEDAELDSNGQIVSSAAPVTSAQVPTVRAADLLVEDDARPLAEHVPGGDVDTPTSESGPPDDTPPTTNLDEVTRASSDQVRELNIRMTNLGVKTRERKLRLIGLALGSEPPGSSADLSVAQFRKVMQKLSGEDELTVAAWLDQGDVDNQN